LVVLLIVAFILPKRLKNCCGVPLAKASPEL